MSGIVSMASEVTGTIGELTTIALLSRYGNRLSSKYLWLDTKIRVYLSLGQFAVGDS